MWSTSVSGGSFPCRFHTTMGTSHTSHAATQQTSSSWNHSVIRAASHSSQPALAAGRHNVYMLTVVPGCTDVPAAGSSERTVVEPAGP